MKITREYPTVTITNKGANFLAEGNPWLYGDEVIDIQGEYENGDVVDVVSQKGKYIGSGFISEKSKIRVRLFSRNASDKFDDEFFARRVAYSVKYRKDIMPSLDNCRVIFGDADGLPGLTVDKFNDILVAQIVAFGMERKKDVIYKALLDSFNSYGITINAIYERNDVAVRSLEGLQQYKGYYFKASDDLSEETIIVENNVKYYVNYIEGQKTGFFLDQKFNRKLIADIAFDKKVLDCFTHTGSFALNAAYGKASHVTAVDISETAIEMAKRNAKLNGLEETMEFVVSDVFDYLDTVKKKQYDLIILDPPAFTKSRSTIKNAYSGYKTINSKAMKLLGKGGYLATCSCSHFMPHKLFEQMLKEAARENNVELKQISFTQQGKDHPILMNVEETDYLKFYILQIC